MPVISVQEIREMKKEDRLRRLEELRSELARLKAQAARGTLENPARIKEIKRAIARILTVEREEKMRASR
ncbi:MAG: 50S ribosomal protein L29 [Thermofilaceae archaeon]|nr:50S ribosomal protein L29 [Thermofilaceae archaeon]MCX8180669.1 50S ribosomal protein L29 [Thermofilaceae archaeon]MDW8003773.1 50S ribosomal protein L29 [Thermofilaceae archaeon]